MSNMTGATVPQTQFTAIKHDIVKELFLKTADQTYVVTRWCFLNRLYLDFNWNSAHSLEKLAQSSPPRERALRPTGCRRQAV